MLHVICVVSNYKPCQTQGMATTEIYAMAAVTAAITCNCCGCPGYKSLDCLPEVCCNYYAKKHADVAKAATSTASLPVLKPVVALGPTSDSKSITSPGVAATIQQTVIATKEDNPLDWIQLYQFNINSTLMDWHGSPISNPISDK